MERKSFDLLLVISAYVAWGVLPMFWAQLSDCDPLSVLFHRSLWSAVFLAVILCYRGELQSSLKTYLSLRSAGAALTSAIFLAINWLSYLWAIKHGDLFAASMAYYICPLLTLAGGALFFGERLCRVQWLAVVILLCGVAVPVFVAGEFPSLALIIGGSWCGYLLNRKRIPTATLPGTFRDTLSVAALIGLYLLFSGHTEVAFPLHASATTYTLFVVSGVITATPMIWLVLGMRSVPLSKVGILQYIAPTLTLVTAILFFGRFPTSTQLASLAVIWLGIGVFFCPSVVWGVRNARRVLHGPARAAERRLPIHQVVPADLPYVVPYQDRVEVSPK